MSNDKVAATEHGGPPLVTRGRRFGLGRADWKPRENCKRCHDIAEKADQMVMNYILANGRQVEIINRLLKDPDAGHEIVALGQLLAEKDALITHLYNLAYGKDDEWVREEIDTYRAEVNENGNEGDDSGAAREEAGSAAGT